MSGLFYGLQIAKTGLYVSQQAINVTGNNIANANTEGYTRQRIVTESIEAASSYGRFGIIVGGAIGGGAQIELIEQIRSDYLDSQYRHESSAMGQWQVRAEEMGFIETIIDENADSSISSALKDFFNSIQDLSMDTANDEIRTNVQQNAIKLTETMNHYYTQLTDLQSQMNESMNVTVVKINTLVTNIADYNKQIAAYELSGEKANELRDKRNLMLDELSSLVNINYAEDSDGHLSVSVEGVDLVNHITPTLLEVRPDLTGVVSGEPDFYEIYYEGTSTPFAYSDGELEGYRVLRDGNSVDEIGIPRILDTLNTLAQGIAEEFNNVHSTGYTMASSTTLSQTGINFFEVPAGGYGDVTAGNITLSAEILSDVKNIAASDAYIDLAAANTNEGNNVIALKLAALTSSSELATVGSFEEYLNSAVVEVAIECAYCDDMVNSQKSIVDNIKDRRESVSGVSTDEEMINLVSYQHAYSAASRVITAIDEALDTLINRTGRVGL